MRRGLQSDEGGDVSEGGKRAALPFGRAGAELHNTRRKHPEKMRWEELRPAEKEEVKGLSAEKRTRKLLLGRRVRRALGGADAISRVVAASSSLRLRRSAFDREEEEEGKKSARTMPHVASTGAARAAREQLGGMFWPVVICWMSAHFRVSSSEVSARNRRKNRP